MTSLFYGPFARLADIVNGRRDGRTGIPLAAATRVSTPHREVLIRRAWEAFDHERLLHESTRDQTMRELAALDIQVDQRQAELDIAKQQVAAMTPPPDNELVCRRPGEERRSDDIVRQRRTREFEKSVQAAQRVEAACLNRWQEVVAERANLQEHARRQTIVSRVRVKRLHDYAHRRLAAYRRSLVRVHPDGAEVNVIMDPLEPAMPVWTRLPLDTPPLPPPLRNPPQLLDSYPLGARVLIGSDENIKEPNVWLPGPDVGPRHAIVERSGDVVTLRDLGSGAGTYQRGVPVHRIALKPGDSFEISDYVFQLSADRSVLLLSRAGKCELVVSNVTAAKGDKPLLTQMSFVQQERSVLAIIGPSGAGKSTLFSAIVQELKISTTGGLYFRGRRISDEIEHLRPRLGFVPQHEPLHASLTVTQALSFASRLRAQGAKKDAKLWIELCKKLEIDNKLNQSIRSLSGGERKRVSIVMELLAEPHLLLLDEPTSGLDAYMDRVVMELLREVAARDCTVIVVTHSTLHLHLADKVLVVVKGGTPVYCGPPTDLPKAIGKSKDYGDMMAALQEPKALAAEYQNHVEAKKAKELAADYETEPKPRPRSRRGVRGRWLHQFPVLIARQFALVLPIAAIMASEGKARLKATFLAAMPLVIACVSAMLAVLISSSNVLRVTQPPSGQGVSVVVSVLTTLIVLTGQALAYSNLVEERDIIKREARVGLSISALLVAKWLLFAVVAIAQAAVVTWTFVLFRGAPQFAATGMPPSVELFVDLSCIGIAAMSMGLLVSAVAKDLKQAVMITSLTVIAQVAFNGLTTSLAGGGPKNFFALVLLPSRWGAGALGSSVDMWKLNPLAPHDMLWQHSLGQWLNDIGGLIGQAVVFTVLATALLPFALRRSDRD